MFFSKLVGLQFQLILLLAAFYLARIGHRYWRQRMRSATELQPAGDVMRYAMASTLLGGRRFRRDVLALYDNPYEARSLEIGIEADQIVASARKFKRRADAYDWGFVGLALLVWLLMKSNPYNSNGYIAFLLFAAVGGLVALALKKSWEEQFRLMTPFLRENFPASAGASASIEPSASGAAKVLCYGARNPFVGLGSRLGGWSVTIDVNRPSEPDETVRPIAAHELYEVAERAVGALEIPDLRVDRLVFVAGSEARLVPAISPDAAAPIAAPRPTMPAEAARDALENVNVHARGYRAFHMIGWGGEIVSSYLLRIVRIGNAVSVETVHLLLPPVAPRFREIDRIPRRGLLEKIGWALETAGSTPAAIVGSAASVWMQIQSAVIERLFPRATREQKRAARFPDYNFGYKGAIRQLLAADRFNSEFQEFDANRYRQTLDQQILNGITDLLSSKGIDTATLRDQTRIIQNNSVSLTATGDIKLKNVALGRNARSGGGLAALVGGARQRT